MILAVDVAYPDDNKAKVSGILFEHFTQETPNAIFSCYVGEVAPYEPGLFYKRELPCILALIDKYQLRTEWIIVDGLVHLPDGGDALGMHLYKALESRYDKAKHESLKVIGVAKNGFRDMDSKYDVFRGKSNKPLIVTSSNHNKDLLYYQDLIRYMHGEGREPTLLRLVDRETKKD